MTDNNNINPVEQVTKKVTPVKMIGDNNYSGCSLILSCLLMYFDQKNKMVEMETVLTQEKDSLANELRLMILCI